MGGRWGVNHRVLDELSYYERDYDSTAISYATRLTLCPQLTRLITPAGTS